MAVSIKSNNDGISGAIQVNGVDKIAFDENGVLSASNIITSGGIFSSNILQKADSTSHCFIKTGGDTLQIKANSHVRTGANVVSFAGNTNVTMPSLVGGSDYSIWVSPDGTIQAIVDPYESPAVAPVSGAVKIGGFHYGLVAPGTTPAAGSFNTTTSNPLVSMVWDQGLVDDIAGINKHSLWDLLYRPKSDPRGMSCAGGKFWFDIYFCGTDHITYGTSRYNSNVASGTVLPKIPEMFGGDGSTTYTTFTWHEAAEVAMSHSKRLFDYDEFQAAAFGVTENQSLGGSSVTTPNAIRQAGYTSKWGGEQMTGHHWTWANNAHGVAGTGWTTGVARGQAYGTPYGALYGGSRGNASYSGSRASYWGNGSWFSRWYIGLRAASAFL